MKKQIMKQKRLRACVLDRKTGRPLTGIPIMATAETKGGKQIGIGVLASDHAGFVSFDLQSLGAISDDVEHVWIYRIGDEANRVDGRAVDQLAPGSGIVPILTDPLPVGPHIPRPQLPAIQGSDPDRCFVSPNSFYTNPSARLGEGGCEILLPSNSATHEFRFRQVIRTIGENLVIEEPPPDLTHGDIAPPLQRMVLARGYVLEYKVTWYPLGHSLGRLLYSLPLAPCESVNLAVIDWSRRDEATRGEALTVTEDLVHSQRRDRTIEETVKASLDEWQGGGSFMGGLAGSYGAGAGLSISGALGGSYASSGGERDLAANVMQKLSDNIVQTSRAVRSLQSTVVTQVSQQEREAIQTRTVTNHNHCHTMTILYYEVLRHYRVVTECVSQQRVLFVDHLVGTKFDEENALCHRLILERVLLDPRLRSCFDALAKLQCAKAMVEESGMAGGGGVEDDEIQTMQARIRTGDGGTDGDVYITLIKMDGTRIRCRFTEPSGSDNPYVLDHEDYNDFESGDDDTYALRPELDADRKRPRWSDLRHIEIGQRAGGNWRLASLRLEAFGNFGEGILFDDTVDSLISDEGSITRPVRRQNPAFAHKRPEDMLTVRERCCVNNLLAPLNCHRPYYWDKIWMLEDPHERVYRFRNDSRYNKVPLLRHIENRPVGSFGDDIAFPELGHKPEPATDEDGNPIEPVVQCVALPTHGVFAEAELGHCNSCEEKDITRFWDWSESPCPEKAPEITGVSPGPRARTPGGLDPSTLPSPVVNIVNPPAAPDPTGLAAVMSLLATPNIFRDMSGLPEVSALLQKLAAGTISLEQASNEANRIQNRQSGGVGGGGAGGAAGRPTPQAQHDQMQVYRNAEEHGELTPEEQRNMGRAYLQNAQYQQSGEDRGPSGNIFSSEGILGPPALDNIQRGRILFSNFAINRTELTSEHITALDQLIQAMQDSSEAFVESIEGRASQTGPEDNNEELASGRANVVAQYLIHEGLDPQRIGRVIGYGARAPLIDRDDVEIDVNRSALVTYSMLVDWPEPARRKPTPREGGTREWAIRLQLSGGAGHAGVGGAFAIGELRKGGVGGEVRHGSFQGFGLGVGAATPGASPGEAQWTPFTTDAPYDFEDFDGTLARLTSLGGGFLVGYSFIYISFPNLGANPIYVGGWSLGTVGADGGVNPFGWWNVEGM